MNFQAVQFFFKIIVVIGFALFFVQCQEDGAREDARKAALENSGNPQTTAPTTGQPATVGVLNLQATGIRVSSGNEACIGVTSPDFREIVSMQYTMKWDPKILKYKGVKSVDMLGLTANNFGTQAVDQGILTFSWFDPNVKGVTLRDGALLYDVCFDAVGEPGSEGRFEFVDDPVIIEISNSASQFLDLAVPPAQVLVE